MSTKKLRACLLCSFVATAAEFRREGCPNCDDKLEASTPNPTIPPPCPALKHGRPGHEG